MSPPEIVARVRVVLPVLEEIPGANGAAEKNMFRLNRPPGAVPGFAIVVARRGSPALSPPVVLAFAWTQETAEKLYHALVDEQARIVPAMLEAVNP